MALWPAKKTPNEDPVESEVADVTAADTEDEPGGLQELTDRLGRLAQLLQETNQQVLAYLVRGQSQTPGPAGDGGSGPLAEKIDSLAEKLDQVEAKLGSLGDRDVDVALQHAAGPTLAEVRHGIHEQFSVLADGIRQLQERIDLGLQEVADLLRPAEPEQPEAQPLTSAEWQRAVLGPQLAQRPGLDFQRQQLLDGLLEGNADACSLVGQLLVFRSASAEKMPPLLKEIGEAYYRWQPKTRPGSNALEEALVDWLKKTGEEAGIANTIELVHPGGRFDSTRHTASTRGVEITEVRGWIVLRDNGKVYTKASVAVK